MVKTESRPRTARAVKTEVVSKITWDFSRAGSSPAFPINYTTHSINGMYFGIGLSA